MNFFGIYIGAELFKLKIHAGTTWPSRFSIFCTSGIFSLCEEPGDLTAIARSHETHTLGYRREGLLK
jgi:hypothetical protein